MTQTGNSASAYAVSATDASSAVVVQLRIAEGRLSERAKKYGWMSSASGSAASRREPSFPIGEINALMHNLHCPDAGTNTGLQPYGIASWSVRAGIQGIPV